MWMVMDGDREFGASTRPQDIGLVVVDTGDARTVIRRRAEQASMLVIGARGHGAVSHFLLGSVAASMTAHPPCPTVIVPVTED